MKNRAVILLGIISLAVAAQGRDNNYTRVCYPASEAELNECPSGPFEATWESLDSLYRVPSWFEDAKFGIFIHWGPYTVAAAGSEWYPKHMYGGLCRHHREVWGKQKEFGYKDFIPLFKAEQFDAAAWAELFLAAGAQYVIPTAEHHDGFAMYDSRLCEWNCVEKGPRRDVIGELAKAVRAKGMKFGVSNHRVENWDFMYPTIPTDSCDLFDPDYATLYGPPQKPGEFSGMGPSDGCNGQHPQSDEFMNEWQLRVMEIIDRYEPDLIYFDNGINYRTMDPWKLRVARYYYNRAAAWGKEVSIQSKSDAYLAGSIRDYERESRTPKELTDYYWQVDDPIGHKFGYVDGLKLQKADDIICNLADNISNNGNLCLNVSPKSDGTIPEDQREILLEIGDWLGRYACAVYGTRGRGGHGTVRYTAKDSVMYALIKKWDGSGVCLKGVDCDAVESLTALGEQTLSVDRDGNSPVVALSHGTPEKSVSVIEIKMKK